MLTSRVSPYQPEYIYVPVYDPDICYYRRPYWGPAITFGVGFPIGAWLNLDFRWGYGGGWGGVYYTGWRREGWDDRGGGCWNCGWIGRSRGRINVNNNVYINNRYTNITVNRTVVNRTVNVNNINRYNSIHKNVDYNNVQANNNRANRVNHGNNGNNGRPGNAPGNYGNTGRPGNSPGNNNRSGVDNKIIDRNIDRNNPQINQYRGRDNNAGNNRPPATPQRTMPTPPQRSDNRQNQQQPQNRPQYQQPPGRQAPQSQMTRPTPHTFSPNEGNFDPRASSQRGQASRQPPPTQQRSAPPPRAQSRPAPAPRGGGRKP